MNNILISKGITWVGRAGLGHQSRAAAVLSNRSKLQDMWHAAAICIASCLTAQARMSLGIYRCRAHGARSYSAVTGLPS